MNPTIESSLHSVFGVLGLLAFVGIFIGVLIYTQSRGNQRAFIRARSLPLHDDSTDSGELS